MFLEPSQLLQIGLLAALAAAAVYATPYGAMAGGEVLSMSAAGKTVGRGNQAAIVRALQPGWIRLPPDHAARVWALVGCHAWRVRAAVQSGRGRVGLRRHWKGRPAKPEPTSAALATLEREKFIARVHQSAHGLALGWCEQRIPNVHNHDDPRRIGVVPGFVFDGIVEGPRLAHLPDAGFVADAEPGRSRKNQRQVNDQTRIGRTGMRRYPSPGLQG